MLQWQHAGKVERFFSRSDTTPELLDPGADRIADIDTASHRCPYTARPGGKASRHPVPTSFSAIDRRSRSESLTFRTFPGVCAAVAAAAVLVSSGCASTAILSGDPDDSWESANRTFYAFNDALDRAVLAPTAHLYLRLPSGLRDSVHNFFDNAAYPGTVLNQLLQGKFEPAMEGSARFVFNTTLGIGGLFDVATGFGLEREEEDFGQTLAVWGLEEGNYIHWPVLGPSSVRHAPGLVVGVLTDVVTYVGVVSAGVAGIGRHAGPSRRCGADARRNRSRPLRLHPRSVPPAPSVPCP